MSIFERLAALERDGGTAVLATVVHAQGSVPRHEGSKMIVYADGAIEGTVGGGEMESRVIEAALTAMRDGRSRMLEYAFRNPDKGDVGVCGGEMQIFIEPLQGNPSVYVIGSGHVGKAVAHLAKWLGFRVVAVDDREGFATPENIPDADEYLLATAAELPNKVEIQPDSYLILTTRGVHQDSEGLPELLESPAAYIGVIGSKRRWETTVKNLREQGVSEEGIARIQSPIGLELNAETPEEIALSIMAEVIMLRKGGTGEPMTHHPKQPKSKGGR